MQCIMTYFCNSLLRNGGIASGFIGQYYSVKHENIYVFVTNYHVVVSGLVKDDDSKYDVMITEKFRNEIEINAMSSTIEFMNTDQKCVKVNLKEILIKSCSVISTKVSTYVRTYSMYACKYT